MEVAKNTVVTLRYTVRDSDGELIDDGKEPLVYLHGGYDGIFPKIEETLQGKKVGDTLRLKLQPEEAFGEYDEELVFVEDISQGQKRLNTMHIAVGSAIRLAVTPVAGKAFQQGALRLGPEPAFNNGHRITQQLGRATAPGHRCRGRIGRGPRQPCCANLAGHAAARARRLPAPRR